MMLARLSGYKDLTAFVPFKGRRLSPNNRLGTGRQLGLRATHGFA